MAVALARRRFLTAEDLFAPGMPDKFVELIEGELVNMSPGGWQHNRIGERLVRIFQDHCATHTGVQCGGDNDGFLIQRNPDTMLCPDASLYRGTPEPGKPWLEFPPDLAVEVLSPSNTATERVLKRARYFDAGTEQVWQVDPTAKTIEIFYRDGRVLRADGNSTIECEGVAAGLQISLPDIFPQDY